ncbi:MAG: hypothetical protein ABI835_20075, partial [Chloroflexota bacterium]
GVTAPAPIICIALELTPTFEPTLEPPAEPTTSPAEPTVVVTEEATYLPPATEIVIPSTAEVFSR